MAVGVEVGREPLKDSVIVMSQIADFGGKHQFCCFRKKKF
jgi:hypothetical protein